MPRHYLEISSVQGKTEDPKLYRRDTRGLSRKISDFLKRQSNFVFLSGMFLVLAIAAWMEYAWTELFLFFLSGWMYVWGRKTYKLRHLPVRLPAYTGVPDYADWTPGHFKPNKARGIFFLGNSKTDEAEDGYGAGEEFWIGDADMRRHFLVLGSTGSGKTVTLVGMAYNSLAMGSGLIYIDPKADAKLFTQIYRIARFLGREEDVRVLNFMTGNQDKAAGTKRSNSVNPFAFADATSLSDVLSAMIPASEGDNAIFSQRAIGLIKVIMPPLVEMRDRNEKLLSVSTIREYLSFDKFIELAKRAHKGDFSDKVKSSMASYLASIQLKPDGEPMAQQKAGGKPPDTKATMEQFQYATMYFTRAMDALATDYGYIYNVIRGEVDYRDVFFNRRILVVLLPALEKNENEIALLGKLVLFAIKNALASGLGSRIEGTADETLNSRPSSSKSPLLLVLDEYAALQVKGFAEAATQGRSLGASCVFANQDLPGFKKASEAEADQILANTRTQIFMYQGDMNQTMDYIVKKCGQSAIMKTTGYAIDKNASLSASYADKMEASFEMTQRAVAQDFLKLTEGEFFLVFDDRFVVGQSFFDPMMDPSGSDIARVNRFLMVSPPEYKALELMATEGEALGLRIREIIEQKRELPSVPELPRDPVMKNLVEWSRFFEDKKLSAEEEAISIVWTLVNGLSVPTGIGSGSSGKGSSGAELVSPLQKGEEAAASDDESLAGKAEEEIPAEISRDSNIFLHRAEDSSIEEFSEEAFDQETSQKERLSRLVSDPGAYKKAVKIESWLSGAPESESRKTMDDFIRRTLSNSGPEGQNKGNSNVRGTEHYDRNDSSDVRDADIDEYLGETL